MPPAFGYLPDMWYPPYRPDTEKLERLVAAAGEQGHPLSIEDLRVLDYLQLCEELKAQKLTTEKMSRALGEDSQFLYPRLVGLEAFGLLDSSYDGDHHWRTSKLGRSLLVEVGDVGMIGERLRPSSLTD